MKIALQLKVNLENLTALKPDGDDFRWYLKLKCLSCGEVTVEYIYIDLLSTQPLKGGRGEASLVLKCKLCSRENSINILKESVSQYNNEDNNRFKSIVHYDCRGVEPVDFSPRVGWTAAGYTEESGESGSKFNDIDLSEGEWADYDEKSSQSVGVYEIEHKFITIK